MTTDAYHLDGDIIRADDGAWCQPATAIEKQLFAAAAVSAADNAALRKRVEELEAALCGLIEVIDAAGLYNLSTGVQLGQTVWYVKASDALDAARALLSQPKEPT